MNNNSRLATAIHWPECWDTAAYPTVESALSEVYAFFKCSECAPTLVKPQADSAARADDELAVFEWLCRTYVQRADRRQRSMGLQYTMAETHELACAIAMHSVHRPAEAMELTYTSAIGDAGQAYMDRFKPYAHPLPATFRWEELWDALFAAATRQSKAST